MTPIATVAISTRNRREELRGALRSAVAQEGDVEVLVIDDGSTDGTAEMVAAEFPQVRVERFEASAGLIARRNQLARLARGPILVSMDDDAVLTDPGIVRRTVADFDHDRIGAVAMAYVEVGRGETHVRQAAPGDGVWVTGRYIGTAHALRTDVFDAVGGYREDLFRQTEELDYCTRMVAAGWLVRLGTAPPVHHLESPKRSMPLIVHYDCRNEVLHAWRNVPLPYFLVRLAKVLVHGALVVPRRTGHLRPALTGLARGLSMCRPSERAPVSRAAYRLTHLLRNREAVRLSEIEDRLPPVRHD